MEIQSQDVEKQRQAAQGEPRPNEDPPHDRPPGQPHDTPSQSDQDDDKVERAPTEASSDEDTGQTGRRPQSPPRG